LIALDVIQHDGSRVNIVDSDIEKPLDLVGMEVHSQDTIDTDTDHDVGHNFSGDGHAS
jgi:hypothetical protein